MEWLEVLRRKADVEGETIHDTHNNNIENFINTSFADSPTYLVVDIDDVDYDARLITEKRYTVASSYETKKLQLRPHVKVDAGRVARFHDKNWLIVFFEDRELEPKAHIRFCNNSLDMKNGNSYPCVIDSTTSQSQKIIEENWVDLSPNTLKITVGYNEDTHQIEENDRFVINGTAWEVQGVDRYSNVYEGVGIVNISVKKVALREDEITKPEEEPIPEDIYATIVGDSEVSINEDKQYLFELYIDGQRASDRVELVEWQDEDGNIFTNGQFTAPNNTGYVTITAHCKYYDSSNELQSVTAEKTISIFNPSEWGWS